MHDERWQRPTVGNTTKQILVYWTCESQSVALIFTSKMFLLTDMYTWNGQCIYIVTYKPHDVCVTVNRVATIRTFTTSLHTPFTSVPELGAISQPFAHGTKQPYSYDGSDDSDSLVSVYKQYCQKTTCLVTKKLK